METNTNNQKNIYGSIILVVGVVILIAVSALIVGSFFDSSAFDCTISNDANSSQSILTASSSILSPIGIGITSNSVTRKNDTWLDFDGDDDVLTERYDTI